MKCNEYKLISPTSLFPQSSSRHQLSESGQSRMRRFALSYLKIVFLKVKDALFPVPRLYSSVTGGNFLSEKCMNLDFNDIRWKVKKRKP